LLGWIGFGVPDWQAFQRYNGSTTEYYGLWAYCQEPAPLYNSICKRWSTAEDELFNGTRPDFVKTAEGLITVGMIFLSLGLIAGVFAAILPLLAYLAGGLTFIAFLFLVIGLPIFGKQSNNLSQLQGNATYNKRYGFWLIVPTIILSFLAAILFLITGFFYQRFGFGNIASNSYSQRPYGGQQLLGPANALGGMPYAARPGYGMMYNQYQGLAGLAQPSLLSQYIAQRMPRYYGPVVVRRTVISALPQPSIAPIVSQPVYVTPAYYRNPVAAQPAYGPLINLTGSTLVGPPVRSAQYSI
jgi:hypothetical protein